MENNIKKIRKKLKITQKQLARYLKISQQAVSYIENGNTNVSSQRMLKICKYLNHSVVEVFPEMDVTNK